MDFYLDLQKAMLNFAKLVKKPVQVKGKNGKTFTRMQWVSPEEASTGHGVRKISTKEGFQKAVMDGMDNHPQYHEALKDQGVDYNTFEDHHPHFFLPETEGSVKRHDERNEYLENHHGFGAVVSEGDHHLHYPHGVNPPDHMHPVYDEHHFVKPDGSGGAPEDAIDIIKDSIRNIPLSEGAESFSKLSKISKEVSLKHWSAIKKHIKEAIEKDFKDDKDPDAFFIKHVQLGALENGNMDHMLNVAHHPEIARATVDHILGEEKANQYREHLKHASLSINFPGMHIDSISKNGYRGSQLEDYVRKQGGDRSVIKLHEVLSAEGDFDEKMDMIRELMRTTGDYFWSDVEERADAEHNAIGLELEYRKPTYLALNPLNKSTGAATYYGNRWMKIDESLLKYCTATMDDSFFTSRSFAKIFSMDHLKDMFILKQLHGGQDEQDFTDEPDGWAMKAGEIPFELQYHKPHISTDQFEVMPDAIKIEKEKQKAKTMADWDKWDTINGDDPDVVKDYCGFTDKQMETVENGELTLGEAIEQYKPHMLLEDGEESHTGPTFKPKSAEDWDSYSKLPFSPMGTQMSKAILDKMNEAGMDANEKGDFMFQHVKDGTLLSEWLSNNKPDLLKPPEDMSDLDIEGFDKEKMLADLSSWVKDTTGKDINDDSQWDNSYGDLDLDDEDIDLSDLDDIDWDDLDLDDEDED